MAVQEKAITFAIWTQVPHRLGFHKDMRKALSMQPARKKTRRASHRLRLRETAYENARRRASFLSF